MYYETKEFYFANVISQLGNLVLVHISAFTEALVDNTNATILKLVYLHYNPVAFY